MKEACVKAEIDPGVFSDPETLAMGGINALVSKCVSKANEKANETNQLKFPDATCYIAGRIGEENYKEIKEMVECYKKIKEVENDERIETAKKTIMVFPGLT